MCILYTNKVRHGLLCWWRLRSLTICSVPAGILAELAVGFRAGDAEGWWCGFLSESGGLRRGA